MSHVHTVPLEARTKSIRLLVTVATAIVTLAATASYIAVSAGDSGLNIFQTLSVPLFAILFGWIAFSFCLATIGFVVLARRPSQRGGSREIVSRIAAKQLSSSKRTAVLMPIYNESPQRVFAGVQAMLLSLRARGVGNEFEFYILSDSTNLETWLQEEVAWANLVESLDAGDCVFYRHRPMNTSRKAGNIADFVERWGSRHDFMIVLDADSLMSAATMQAMVARISADERLGILQVPPVPIGRNSLFARLQQFAASVYGSIFVQGFSVWAGNEGNYWGHNAIIRVEAFRRHCDLPVLPGKSPLGGEILSHDFVEAALMVQSGWKVLVDTDLDGSYEECPTTLADYAKRDQRWCQGNLQHAKLLFAENYRPLSRLHFTCGVMSYLASPLWMLFTVLCIAGTIVDSDSAGSSAGPLTVPGALMIFSMTIALLLLPKLWSLMLVSKNRRRVSLHGGLLRLWASAVLEIVVSVLLSPIMAVYHTRFVIAVLRGTSVRWNSQQRDEQGVGWQDATKQFIGLTLGGLLVSGLLLIFTPSLSGWFSPLMSGAMLSIPLSVALGSRRAGESLRRGGLLLIPAETHPPKVCRYHRVALQESKQALPAIPSLNWFEQVIHSPRIFAIHSAIQRSTASHTAMPRHQSKAIEAAFAAAGAEGIPAALRSALLADHETLKALHLEAQLFS